MSIRSESAKQFFELQLRERFFKIYSKFSNREIIIWGTGNYGKFICNLLKSFNMSKNIKGFCNTYHDDSKVVYVEDLLEFSPKSAIAQYPNAVYIIASDYADDILEYIKNSEFAFIETYVSDYYTNLLEKQLIYYTHSPAFNYKSSVQAQKHYQEVISDIKHSGRKRINFAAYVVFDSCYGMDEAFQLMMNDPEKWNPKIVVIPDVARGKDHEIATYVKTKEFFVRHYGEDYVIDGYDIKKDTYIDPIDQFDIVYYANPYDSMTDYCHSIQYAATKHVLPIYVSYGYDVGHYTTLSRLQNPELNLVWKCFVDTVYTFQDYKKYQIFKGENVSLVGYSKMDKFDSQKRVDNSRKKILITPHHTVNMPSLPLSNFLSYYDLILQLPEMFPDIDFVFRPHPLLFTALINNNFWTKEQVNDYLDKLQAMGVEYSYGGDYLSLYSECDAIINDCGSFTVEWLFTGKPGCFVYNEKLKDKHLTLLMQKAIGAYDIAHSREDIIDFIKKVEKNEYQCNNRMQDWVKENIAINYPDVSSHIIQEIDILGSK